MSAKQNKILANGGVSADDLRILKVGLGALLVNDDSEDGSNEESDKLNVPNTSANEETDAENSDEDDEDQERNEEESSAEQRSGEANDEGESQEFETPKRKPRIAKKAQGVTKRAIRNSTNRRVKKRIS